MIIMHLDIAGGLDPGIKRVIIGQIKPQLNIILNRVLAFLVTDSLLDVKGGFGSLSVEFSNQGFCMAEIVTVDGVSLAGVVGPGLDLDGSGLGTGEGLGGGG